MAYCCPCVPPGYINQPHHIPGYAGHIPTIKTRNGKTFGNASRDVIEDPCVAQAPCPILAPPMCPCPPKDDCCRNPIGCDDIGCYQPSCCPKEPPRTKCPCIPNIPPCIETCDPRAHHLNRGPYACPCRPDPDPAIFRCCEGVSSSYAGHVPGFVHHSTGRTTGLATWGTKQYMQNCWYNNSFFT